MSETLTAKPADAMLLRSMAHYDEQIATDRHEGRLLFCNEQEAADLLHRSDSLRALADILEKITPLNVHLLNRVLDMGCTCGVVTVDDNRDWDAATKRLPELIEALEALTK